MAGRKSDFTLPTNTLDDLFSTQEERDDAKLAKIRDIPLTEIDNFPDHPFKVRDDEDMLQLVESVKERGVITPATVRKHCLAGNEAATAIAVYDYNKKRDEWSWRCASLKCKSQ